MTYAAPAQAGNPRDTGIQAAKEPTSTVPKLSKSLHYRITEPVTWERMQQYNGVALQYICVAYIIPFAPTVKG